MSGQKAGRGPRLQLGNLEPLTIRKFKSRAALEGMTTAQLFTWMVDNMPPILGELVWEQAGIDQQTVSIKAPADKDAAWPA